MDIITELHQIAGIEFNWFRREPGLRRYKAWPPDRAHWLMAFLGRCSMTKEKSVAEQVTDGLAAVQAYYGQAVPESRQYKDFGSASDWGRNRPGFDELLRLVATDGAVDVVPVWAINRLTRTPAEGDAFMFFAWRNDVRIFVVKDYLADIDAGGNGSRAEYSLRNDSDWDHVRDEIKKGSDESRAKSGDITRGHRGNRANGKQAGEPPGGWKLVYDPGTGEAHPEVVLAQATVLVRELIALAARSSPSMVAWKLNQDDVATFTRTRKKDTETGARKGTPLRRRAQGRWYGHTVQVTALNPVHIGMICKKPMTGPGKAKDIWDLHPAADYFPIVRGPRKDVPWAPGEREELGWAGTEEEFVQLWETRGPR